MRFPRNTKIFRGQLDPAPYAGVFFLLVLFLLLHSSLVFTPGVPIQLPETVDLPGATNATVGVAVDADGQLYFDHQVCDPKRLKEKLQEAAAAAQEPLTLVVQADKRAKYEALVQLGLLAREVGIKEVLLATRPPVVPVVTTPVK